MKMLQAGQRQREIAAMAARLMAEDGLDTGQAKRKAASIAGHGGRSQDVALPDNDLVEAALREYLRTFHADSHPQLLYALRSTAARWMETLEDFQPHLVGPVLNGSATRHSHVSLHLFADSAKEVEMALLDRQVAIRVGPPPQDRGRAQETIGFLAPSGPDADPVALLLTVYDRNALRISCSAGAHANDPSLHPVERAARANLSMVRQLLAQTAPAQAV